MPERTFARWCAKGLPVVGQGEKARYPWPEVFRWLTEQIERRARDAAKPANFEDARARTELAKAEMAELDLAERRGELMTVADGEKVMIAAFSRVRAQVLAMPGKYAPRIVGIPTVARANEILRAVADELMQDLRGSVDGLEEELDAEAA
jgi:phage terminase Nu1 subunit (DNA packaging protein)